MLKEMAMNLMWLFLLLLFASLTVAVLMSIIETMIQKIKKSDDEEDYFEEETDLIINEKLDRLVDISTDKLDNIEDTVSMIEITITFADGRKSTDVIGVMKKDENTEK